MTNRISTLRGLRERLKQLKLAESKTDPFALRPVYTPADLLSHAHRKALHAQGLENMRSSIEALEGYNQLRTSMMLLLETDVSDESLNRLTIKLVKESNGKLSVNDVEALALIDVVKLLESTPLSDSPQNISHDGLVVPVVISESDKLTPAENKAFEQYRQVCEWLIAESGENEPTLMCVYERCKEEGMDVGTFEAWSKALQRARSRLNLPSLKAKPASPPRSAEKRT